MTLLRDLPRFRYLWLSKAISSTGTGVGRIALVLFAASSGPGAVSLVLIGTALPLLAGPLAGAVADRVDQRRMLAGCEAGQGVIYAILAVTRPSLPALLPLVILASLLATFGAPAGKSAVRRLVPAERRGQANALLSLAMNLQIIAGPAIGGVLAGITGVSAAFGVNAASFAVSALLLAGLGPLAPLERPASQARAGLLADTVSGLRYARDNPVVRGLVLGTAIFVTFAAMDNVALVFLVRQALHGPAAEFGIISAAFGVGMVTASLALTVKANRRPAAFWLTGGVVAGAVGMVLTGIAPSAAVACAGQAVAGAGNTAELVGTDTLVQERVPAHMLGRAFGTVYGGAQLGSALAYVIAGPLVTLTGPRATFVIGGVGALAGAFVLASALRSGQARPVSVRGRLELARLVGGEAVSPGDRVPAAGERALARGGLALRSVGGPQGGVGPAVVVAAAGAHVLRPPGKIGVHLGGGLPGAGQVPQHRGRQQGTAGQAAELGQQALPVAG